MNEKADRAWSWLDSVAGATFPPKVRRYLTIRSMTVFEFLLFTWDVLFKMFVPHAPFPPSLVASERVIESPLFLIPYDLVMFLLMYVVLKAKTRPEHGYLRALCYGIILAAFLGECILLFIPWRG